MDEEWGPWIEHDGSARPMAARAGDTVICFMIGGGAYGPFVTDGGLSSPWFRVSKYRIRKPRGLTILEEIAKGIREPVDA